jgi:hypothetical protein
MKANEHSFKLLQVCNSATLNAITLHALFAITTPFLPMHVVQHTEMCHELLVTSPPKLPFCKQEYLDAARKGGELGRTASVPFKFLFYMHKDHADDMEISTEGLI